VQEGRTLYGGKFDLDDIWARRDLTLDTDSTKTDTLSSDRNLPFLFILAYQPDSLELTGSRPDGNDAFALDEYVTKQENQLLFEMARYNFTNFMVRNFDLQVDRQPGISRILISGFLNYDEALQYARRLYADETMASFVLQCRSLIISDHNLRLIGTRYSYKDYDEFYERVFLPLPITNEELLNTPTDMEVFDADDEPEEEEEEEEEYEDDDDFDLW
jgi:hypothetical protein